MHLSEEEKFTMGYIQPAVFKDRIGDGDVFVVVARPGMTTPAEVVTLATKVGATTGEGKDLKLRIDFRNNQPYIGWADESELLTPPQLEEKFANFKPLTFRR